MSSNESNLLVVLRRKKIFARFLYYRISKFARLVENSVYIKIYGELYFGKELCKTHLSFAYFQGFPGGDSC